MLSENIWLTELHGLNHKIIEYSTMEKSDYGKQTNRISYQSKKYHSEDEDLCVRPHISHCGNLRLFYGRSLSSGNSCEQLGKKTPIYKSTFQISFLYQKKVFLCLVVLKAPIYKSTF